MHDVVAGYAVVLSHCLAVPWPSLTVTFGASLGLGIAAIPISKTEKLLLCFSCLSPDLSEFFERTLYLRKRVGDYYLYVCGLVRQSLP